MAHTLPDYTTKYKLAKIFGNVDNAELAARLGGPTTMDRRGNIIWYDDFEAAAALKWDPNIAPGGTVAYSAERAFMGNQSLKLVTDNDLGDFIVLRKSFPLPVERTIGLEFMFCITVENPIVQPTLEGWDGTNYFIGQLLWNQLTGKLYYYNAGFAWTELPVYDATTLMYEPWFYMKLVINWDTKEYVRAIFGGTTYDLSGIPMCESPSITLQHVDVYLGVENTAGAISTVYIDNVVLTQNEP